MHGKGGLATLQKRINLVAAIMHRALVQGQAAAPVFGVEHLQAQALVVDQQRSAVRRQCLRGACQASMACAQVPPPRHEARVLGVRRHRTDAPAAPGVAAAGAARPSVASSKGVVQRPAARKSGSSHSMRRDRGHGGASTPSATRLQVGLRSQGRQGRASARIRSWWLHRLQPAIVQPGLHHVTRRRAQRAQSGRRVARASASWRISARRGRRAEGLAVDEHVARVVQHAGAPVQAHTVRRRARVPPASNHTRGLGSLRLSPSAAQASACGSASRRATAWRAKVQGRRNLARRLVAGCAGSRYRRPGSSSSSARRCSRSPPVRPAAGRPEPTEQVMHSPSATPSWPHSGGR
jgi:hypothetical protein